MSRDPTTFFREMTLSICGSLDISEALEQAFVVARQYLPADSMGLGFHEPNSMTIGVVAATRCRGAEHVWVTDEDELRLPPRLASLIASPDSSMPEVGVINCPEDLDLPALIEVFPGLVSDSALFIPLEVKAAYVGVLLVSAAGHHRYTPEHVMLVDQVREPFAIAMSNARRHQELRRLKDRLAEDNRALTADIKRSLGSTVIGAKLGLREVMEQVHRIAASSSPALLLGETGTGKEVLAHAIHRASPRSKGPMISLQCGAVPDTLLDSELFGHEQGAFTGALARKRGRFERADGGTLFLDEIGELSLEAQVKLLRVLQEKRLERVGGTTSVEVDVRVIAATHRDLESMVHDGSFREDLWYRLNVLPIRIPPLRMRRQDIPALVAHFVERKAGELGLPAVPAVAGPDLQRLEAYDWPGNVRELQNIVERALLICGGGPLRFSSLLAGHRASVAPESPRRPARPRSMDEAIADHIRDVLVQADGQVAGPGGAAELLRMNPSTLRHRMRKLGITSRTRRPSPWSRPSPPE